MGNVGLEHVREGTMTDAGKGRIDFEAFWDAVDRELARFPAASEIEPLQLRSTDFGTTYAVRLTSIGSYRIFGYYSVPRGDGSFPGLMLTPRYGSVNHIPDFRDRQRYAVLQVMHRGQRLADQPFAAAYPGLLTHGIDDPGSYVYRGIVADCLRSAEFLLLRPEVDPSRVGVVGDDLALITAARRPWLAAVQASNLIFFRLPEACERTDAYPVEEVNDYLRAFPNRREAVARTLALFDPVQHAPRITATTLLAVSDAWTVGGPEWLEPLASALGGPVEQYALTHEGATDQDWLDGWMARQLGAEPRGARSGYASATASISTRNSGRASSASTVERAG
jgi:cephalosporin-C deacetylase